MDRYAVYIIGFGIIAAFLLVCSALVTMCAVLAWRIVRGTVRAIVRV